MFFFFWGGVVSFVYNVFFFFGGGVVSFAYNIYGKCERVSSGMI